MAVTLLLLVLSVSKMLLWIFLNSLHISDWAAALSENVAHFV